MCFLSVFLLELRVGFRKKGPVFSKSKLVGCQIHLFLSWGGTLKYERDSLFCLYFVFYLLNVWEEVSLV